MIVAEYGISFYFFPFCSCGGLNEKILDIFFWFRKRNNNNKKTSVNRDVRDPYALISIVSYWSRHLPPLNRQAVTERPELIIPLPFGSGSLYTSRMMYKVNFVMTVHKHS